MKVYCVLRKEDYRTSFLDEVFMKEEDANVYAEYMTKNYSDEYIVEEMDVLTKLPEWVVERRNNDFISRH